MLEEYYRNEEEALHAQIQQQNEALCPVCKKNKLLQNKQVIFCGCGLRIDTKVRS
jgi:DNA-directed RNA polymerase subunit RPC12/RpoP